MKRAVVTGATGFVGANLARRLVRDGHEVHLLVRPGFRAWRVDEIRAEIHLHPVDLGDAGALRDLVRNIAPDWIFHLAAHGAYPTETDLDQIVQTNLIGTMNLVRAALAVGFEAFVNTGSSSEYGFKGHAPPETEWLDPNSYYAVTKASGTLFCRFTARSHGVRLPTLRLYSVYGPYEEPTRLIPALLVHGLDGRLPPLAHPETARDFTYVDDVVDAFLLAATRRDPEPGAVFNIGSGVQTTLREVVEIARRVMQLDAEAEWSSLPARSWDTTVWVAENAKARRELGWKPRHSVECGFRLTLDWLRGHERLQRYYRERLAISPHGE